jgi:hypothetical protein
MICITSRRANQFAQNHLIRVAYWHGERNEQEYENGDWSFGAKNSRPTKPNLIRVAYKKHERRASLFYIEHFLICILR